MHQCAMCGLRTLIKTAGARFQVLHVDTFLDPLGKRTEKSLGSDHLIITDA